MAGRGTAVVVGGGVAGLATALKLGRRGAPVTLVERDDTPMPATADAAFDWDRRGAPQVRHSHALLARLRNLLLEHEPDVLARLLAEGATEIRFGDDPPPTISDFRREPGDDELVMIAARRTTFEWVLRTCALAEPTVRLLTGNPVVGLLGADGIARGVRLADGAEIAADVVVLASGRRGLAAGWSAAIGGGSVPEAIDDTGIVYFSRFYRLLPGASFPPRAGPIGGDLGYVKYGVFVGDNDTFSITLAIPAADDELRRLLTDPDVFERVGRELVVTTPYLDGRAAPITDGVHAMGGLVNRWRDYVIDGRPAAVGLFAVGDALVCTNPLYGRGCSTAVWTAQLLVEALEAHPDDPVAAALAYDAAVRVEIRPWYRAARDQDAEARRVAAALLAGEDPDADTADPRTFVRAVLRDGLAPAMRSDAVVLRAFFRTFNLLTAPDAIVGDPDLMGRVLAAYQDRANRPPEPELGPRTRAALVAAISA
jgi:2-polyprenyl-6-methoxyphenol hydroxylase-like FAD-dependent oxidoreductase